MSDAIIQKPLSGWWVFLGFAAFFGVIIIVNSVFITQALKTHSGLVVEDAYKKGLAYNNILQEARSQPQLDSKVTFENGTLIWSLLDKSGAPIENANVSAKFIWPVKDGDDFSVNLRYERQGQYIINPDFPFKGVWKLQLSATWDNQSYKTATQIFVK